MHDEVLLTREEYKDFIVAKEKLNLLETIIGNSITIEYGKPSFSEYEFLRAMKIIGYNQFDGIWQIVKLLFEQEKENENE